MPLGLARSKKGSENRGNRRNPMPFPGETGRKGNVKRETKRNPMLLRLARSKKGSENRGNRRNLMPFLGVARRKGSEKRETAGIRCLSPARQGEKATKIEKTAENRCLSRA